MHKVVGLVSGGKDSTFNLLHCVANGHELVALATLTPGDKDELDSHLYQSVGTNVVPLIAQAMGMPLYTGVIRGKAIRQGEYETTEGDETEDLTQLLQRVMAEHDCTAVASGAILSNYQRLRIEHVCGRLGLTSLAYLWQQPQMALLDRMLAMMEVIVVKVAGVGLGVDLVGRRLSEVRPLLARLVSPSKVSLSQKRQYGSHPAGEGGEYETLTLSNPLFSHRVVLDEAEVIVIDPEPFPVAYLRVRKAHLEEKVGWVRPTQRELQELLRPVLDEESVERLKSPLGVPSRSENQQAGSSRWPAASASGWSAASVQGIGGSVEDQLRACFDQVELKGVTHVTLLLSDMSLFAEANRVYATYFGTSPPSRATVAVPLPPGQHVRLEVVRSDGPRQALHVQSLSYWAPANIGPYSQAVTVAGRVFLAGQVPLIPASLSLAPEPQQVVLAIQHVRKVIEVLRSRENTGGGWTGWVESCTAWWTSGGFDRIRHAWRDRAPLLIVRAKQLPRAAQVEFQVNLATGRREEEDAEPVYSGGAGWEMCAASDGRGYRAVVFGESGELPQVAVVVRVYHTGPLDQEGEQACDGADLAWVSRAKTCWTFIPVLEIHDRHGHSHAVAMEVFA